MRKLVIVLAIGFSGCVKCWDCTTTTVIESSTGNSTGTYEREFCGSVIDRDLYEKNATQTTTASGYKSVTTTRCI